MLAEPKLFLNVTAAAVLKGAFRPSFVRGREAEPEQIPYALNVLEASKGKVVDFTCVIEGDESGRVYQGVLDSRLRYLALAPQGAVDDLARWGFTHLPE